jgi:hypothetical protein
MGVYSNDIVFQNDPPFVTPKFAILVKYFEELDAFKDDILVNVYFPGDQKDSPAMTVPISRSLMQAAPYEMEEGQERLVNLTLPLMFSPFSISKQGFLKVRAICGDVVTNLGSIMVRKIKPDETIQGLPSTMRYFESLARGSKFHHAKRAGDSLLISAIEETDPHRIEFQKIAHEAQKRALAEGHTFKPHSSSRDSYGWDSALIIFK